MISAEGDVEHLGESVEALDKADRSRGRALDARLARDHAVVQRDLLHAHFVARVAASARAGLGRVDAAHDVEAAVALAARPLHRQDDVVLVVGRREVDERRVPRRAAEARPRLAFFGRDHDRRALLVADFDVELGILRFLFRFGLTRPDLLRDCIDAGRHEKQERAGRFGKTSRYPKTIIISRTGISMSTKTTL